jgi:trigger factor
MQVNVEKLSPVLVELQVQVPADRVKSEVERAYAEVQRTARVRGFRQGKAPRDVLAHLYGGRIHADVAQRLVDETFNKALADKQVQPLNQPSIVPAQLRPAEPFSYKARFEVRPDISSVKWEGLEVKRPSTQITDAMIDAEIQNLRRTHSTLQAPAEERAAKAGDVTTIVVRIEVEGSEKDAQQPQEFDAELGASQIMKELEDALLTMRPGETKPVEVAFNERHQNPELRGKKGVFHLTLKEVRERIFPDVDEEFAKDCGEESLEKLREALKAKLEKELKQRATDNVAEQLMIELCKHNPIPLPPSLVEQQAQQTEREHTAAARRAGQRPDTSADFRARVRMDAEIKVRAGLLMSEIAREKQVSITDQDIEKGYAELAEQTGKNVAKVKAEYRDAKKREILLSMILEDKILDLIEAAATVTES